MKKVSLATDGSCLGNPGPGGWACVLRFGGVKRELFGFDPDTTNNRLELMAPIQGLLALKEPCEVEITTDSKYVYLGITDYISEWKQRHWWRKHESVRHADLWIELDELASLHKPTWAWTRSHADHEDNARCDLLARNAAATQKVLGRMEGRTQLFVSTWVWITCRPKPDLRGGRLKQFGGSMIWAGNPSMRPGRPWPMAPSTDWFKSVSYRDARRHRVAPERRITLLCRPWFSSVARLFHSDVRGILYPVSNPPGLRSLDYGEPLE
jgi:ribonuclease HI